MKWFDRHGLAQFLRDYPGMSIAPSRDSEMILEGTFDFKVEKTQRLPDIEDSYQLQIVIPEAFPAKLPKTTEIGHRIPRSGEFHVNEDGTLCLGSPLRLRLIMSEKPDLVGYAERCPVSYLYAISLKLRGIRDFPFGQLDHYEAGVIGDYLELFRLETKEQVIRTLELLGMKRRIANKAPCPCGCGRRLGRCSFNKRIGRFRKVASRHWFRKHAQNPGAGM